MAGKLIPSSILVLIACLCCTGAWAQTLNVELPYEPKPSVYSEATAVVCNRNIPESVELARYYAKARGIPEANIVIVECTAAGEISRDEFERLIEKPLRATMLRRGWWVPKRDPKTGTQDIQSKIQVVALMYGIPLKIQATEASAALQETTVASVDSELAILSQPGLPREGPLSNPYFQSDKPFRDINIPILLVGRVDGPSPQRCKEMIDETILAERSGLWGNAYVDVSGEEGYVNSSLLRAVENIRRIGITTTVDEFDQPFSQLYPFKDPILYLGDGTAKAEKSFQIPEFRFRPGSIAYATTANAALNLHSAKTNWSGSLLGKGVAAVLANVEDPSLEIGFQPDVFTNRLCRGATLIESAYASARAFSWMGVVVGDPLYQPFPAIDEILSEEQFGEDAEVDVEVDPYKVMRVIYARWGQGKDLPEGNLFYRLELASARWSRGEFLEHLALGLEDLGDYFETEIQFMRAKTAYESPVDKLRMDLHLAELKLKQGDKLAALRLLRGAVEEYAGLPEVDAVQFLGAMIQGTLEQ